MRVPAFKNTKIPREDTPEKERKERKWERGEGKKKAKFWAVRRRAFRWRAVRRKGGPAGGLVPWEGGPARGRSRGEWSAPHELDFHPRKSGPHTPHTHTQSVAILAQVGDNHAGFPRLGFSVIAPSLKGEHFSVLLSVVCQSWFGMAFSTGHSLTGVFQQAPSSLDGHSNSAALSSILGRDSFAALFSVSENISFLTTSLCREIRCRCSGVRSLDHDDLLELLSFCHFAVEVSVGCAQV